MDWQTLARAVFDAWNAPRRHPRTASSATLSYLAERSYWQAVHLCGYDGDLACWITEVQRFDVPASASTAILPERALTPAPAPLDDAKHVTSRDAREMPAPAPEGTANNNKTDKASVPAAATSATTTPSVETVLDDIRAWLGG